MRNEMRGERKMRKKDFTRPNKTSNAVYIDTLEVFEIETSYQQIVSVFGAPDRFGKSHDGKVDACWTIAIEGGTVFSIYNWKNGLSYTGTPAREIDTWSVGFESADSVILDVVASYLEAKGLIASEEEL